MGKQCKNKNFSPSEHIFIDLHGATGLRDIKLAEETLRKGATKVGASLISINSHVFEGGGFTALALLSESHISLHSWPETGYLAADIFTCGSCDAKALIPVLEAAFRPEKVVTSSHERGRNLVEA